MIENFIHLIWNKLTRNCIRPNWKLTKTLFAQSDLEWLRTLYTQSWIRWPRTVFAQSGSRLRTLFAQSILEWLRTLYTQSRIMWLGTIFAWSESQLRTLFVESDLEWLRTLFTQFERNLIENFIRQIWTKVTENSIRPIYKPTENSIRPIWLLERLRTLFTQSRNLEIDWGFYPLSLKIMDFSKWTKKIELAL